MSSAVRWTCCVECDARIDDRTGPPWCSICNNSICDECAEVVVDDRAPDLYKCPICIDHSDWEGHDLHTRILEAYDALGFNSVMLDARVYLKSFVAPPQTLGASRWNHQWDSTNTALLYAYPRLWTDFVSKTSPLSIAITTIDLHNTEIHQIEIAKNVCKALDCSEPSLVNSVLQTLALASRKVDLGESRRLVCLSEETITDTDSEEEEEEEDALPGPQMPDPIQPLGNSDTEDSEEDEEEEEEDDDDALEHREARKHAPFLFGLCGQADDMGS